MTTAIAPITTDENDEIAETPVTDLATLRNRLMCSARKRQFLTFLGGICLYDANPAKDLAQTAGDLGVDNIPLAKDRPQFRKCIQQCTPNTKRTIALRLSSAS